MTKTGTELEQLIRNIEEHLLPKSFQIESRKRVYNDDGIQIAEFDLEIRGRLGSTDLAWLIECRDRPSEGPGPGLWIEQLVGRRNRFGFNKVTAVSTTGFAEGAIQFAEDSGIELRTVKEITLESISSWFLAQEMMLLRCSGSIDHMRILFAPDLPTILMKAVEAKIAASQKGDKILISSTTGERISVLEVCQNLFVQNDRLFEGVLPDEPPKPIHVEMAYTNDNSYFYIETSEGNIRVYSIEFLGTVFIKSERVPINEVREYSQNISGEVIAQIAGFNYNLDGNTLHLDFKRISSTGETLLTVRKKEER